jgi:hypothetical protein
MKTYYICDQKQCGKRCSAYAGTCRLTTNIAHAANFSMDHKGNYVEKTPRKASTDVRQAIKNELANKTSSIIEP